MSILLFANRALTTLAAPISAGAVSVTLAPGTGAEFPSPGANEYFIGTIYDAATKLITEIVWVTARSGDTLTIVRGKESTTAAAWNAGDFFSNFWTAGSAQAMLQTGQFQQQTANYAADTGAVNVLAVALDPVPASMAALVGAPIRVLVAHTNTTATATLDVNGLGTYSIKNRNASSIGIGTLVAGAISEVIWDGAQFQYNGQVPPASTATTQAGIDALAPVTAAAIAGAFAFSHANPGYQKFANGAILQWGRAFTASAFGDTVIFPTPFPTNCTVVTSSGFATPVAQPFQINVALGAGPPFANFVVAGWAWNGSAWVAGSGIGFGWVAFGF